MALLPGFSFINLAAVAPLENCNHGQKKLNYSENPSCGVIAQLSSKTAVITAQLSIYHDVDILIKGAHKLAEILTGCYPEVVSGYLYKMGCGKHLSAAM